MTDPRPLPGDPSWLRRMALSRWDNEGGASPPETDPSPVQTKIPDTAGKGLEQS